MQTPSLCDVTKTAESLNTRSWSAALNASFPHLLIEEQWIIAALLLSSKMLSLQLLRSDWWGSYVSLKGCEFEYSVRQRHMRSCRWLCSCLDLFLHYPTVTSVLLPSSNIPCFNSSLSTHMFNDPACCLCCSKCDGEAKGGQRRGALIM